MTHPGKVKSEMAKEIAEDRYDIFDDKRKKDEALAADEKDLKQLEKIERTLLENRKEANE